MLYGCLEDRPSTVLSSKSPLNTVGDYSSPLSRLLSYRVRQKWVHRNRKAHNITEVMWIKPVMIK